MIQNKNTPNGTIGVFSKLKTAGLIPRIEFDRALARHLRAAVLVMLFFISTSLAMGPEKTHKTDKGKYQSRRAESEWMTYANQGFGFSIGYSSDWKATVIPVATLDLMKNYRGESQIVFFTSPSKYAAGFVNEVVSVSRKDLRNDPMSLDDYVKFDEARSREALSDYFMLYEKEAEIAGHKAHLKAYMYGDVKSRRYILIADDIVYALTFNANQEKHSKFLPKAEKIMTSFKLPLPAPAARYDSQPQQGTIIACEECITLYPEKYKDKPQTCPVCKGRKEHFQPARMMSNELAAVEGRELELKIEDLLLRTVLDANKKPVPVKTLKEIREYYEDKLIFHLIYDKFELEPIKAHIFQLDDLIGDKD